MKTLDLDILREGLPSISKAAGSYFAEAAIVCFSKMGHESGVTIAVEGAFEETFKINWTSKYSLQIQRTWNIVEDAIEFGAVALALIMVREVLTLEIIYRSSRGSGVDYWLGKWKSGQAKIHAGIEISGILKATKSNTVKQRINIKKKRLNEFNYPIYIVVVEFSEPMAYFTKV